MPLPFVIHTTGRWSAGQVRASFVASTRKIVPEVEAKIDIAWNAARARLGDKLFDGPMCRLEHFSASPDGLELHFSRTSYRPFLGADLSNGQLVEQFGPDILARPMGVSSALESADGYLLLGRRNDSVAYYPNRVHPFAGALEPRENLDIFAEAYRELNEELALQRDDIAAIHLIGIIEDISIRQPELIFHVRSHRTQSEIESTLDAQEHEGVYVLPAQESEIAKAIADPMLTPVAMASLTLYTRTHLR